MCSPSPRQADRSAILLCNGLDCKFVSVPGGFGAVHDIEPPYNLLAPIRGNAANLNGDISRIGIAKITRFRAAQILEEWDRIAIVEIVLCCDLAGFAPVGLCLPAFAAISPGIFPLNYHNTSGFKGIHTKVSRVTVTIFFHFVAPFLLWSGGGCAIMVVPSPAPGVLVGAACLWLCQGV